MIINDCVLDLKRYWSPYGSVAPPLDWADDSRYGNDMTDGAGAAAPTWVQNASGLWVKAFDGNDYGEITDSRELSCGNGASDTPMTFLCWANVSGVFGGLFNKGATVAADGEYYAYLAGGTNIYWRCIDQSASAYIGVLLNIVAYLGLWTFFAFTYNGGGAYTDMAIYINGVLQATAQSDSGAYIAMENTATSLYIGRRSAIGLLPAGSMMAPTRAYNYNLTADQINAKFASERHWFDGA